MEYLEVKERQAYKEELENFQFEAMGRIVEGSM